MTKDEQRDIVLNFFKERKSELQYLHYTNIIIYEFVNEYERIILSENDCEGWSLFNVGLEIRENVVYQIEDLPFDQEQLITLLNILNPLPE